MHLAQLPNSAVKKPKALSATAVQTNSQLRWFRTEFEWLQCESCVAEWVARAKVRSGPTPTDAALQTNGFGLLISAIWNSELGSWSASSERRMNFFSGVPEMSCPPTAPPKTLITSGLQLVRPNTQQSFQEKRSE
jgi:hypothetical protein